MKTLKTGIIGCGGIFPMHAESIRNIKGVEIAAVCDVKTDRAQAKADKYGCRYYSDYKKMLKSEKLDVVHICTPHYLHVPMVLEAAKHKINILSEKPMGLNPKEGERAIAAAKKNKILYAVISQNRFNPSSQLVKKRIAQGRLGKLKSAKLILSYHKPDSFYKKSDWKGRKALEGGGVVIDQAIHYLDVLCWLVSSPVKYIEASVNNRYHTFIDVEDVAEGVIQFKNGFYACFYLMNYYSYDADTQIEIDTERSRVNIIKDSARIGYFKGGEESAAPKPNEYIDYGDGARDYWGYCHYNQIKDYYDALRNKRKPAITAEDALKTQRIVWAIYESSRLKKKIYL